MTEELPKQRKFANGSRRVTVFIPTELLERLSRFVQANLSTQSNVIRQALEKFLTTQEKKSVKSKRQQ